MEAFLSFSSEMFTSLENEALELRAILEALRARRSAFAKLQWRLLRCVGAELKAAKESGMTWRMVWQGLQSDEFVGSYTGFCKAANRAIEPLSKSEPHKTLRRPKEGKETSVTLPLQIPMTGAEERPEWQIRREETMARLDREAEHNREREARLSRPKIFNPPPFVGRGEQ